MKRLRFSIASLVGIVVFVAFATAALRAATDVWDCAVLGLTLLTFLTAVLLAVHRTGRRRAFWIGFALFGWSYLVLSLVPPVESRLPTTKGLAYLNAKRPDQTFQRWVTRVVASPTSSGANTDIAIAFAPDGNAVSTSSQGVVRLWNSMTGVLVVGPGGTGENFVRIGHMVLALVLAFLGGHLSRGLRQADTAGSLHGGRP